MSDVFDRAAQAIAGADGLFIGAGAGMGVDSGLPDFRGNEGFWRAYPPFQARGLRFVDLANPRWFNDDPQLAWGFYGHRQNLYRDTAPHDGFQILRRWATELSGGAFAFTSNVDGHFQRAGFDAESVYECHGSIHHLQCSRPCRDAIWPAGDTDVDVNETFRAREPLPVCPGCQRVARPNILMFGDGGWLNERSDGQARRLQSWLRTVKRPAVIELGAGTAVPTVRWQSEQLAARFGVELVRVNPREAQGPRGTIGIECGALEALTEIDKCLRQRSD